MADIKLFVCCHRLEEVPKHPLLYPIQVGTALTDTRFPGFLYDDTGENISEKNRSYCELTAQYWAWKNIEADYYGFFHYRRYLYPDQSAKYPYRIEKRATPMVLRKLGYSKFDDIISKYDLVVPKKENMCISVQEHYSRAPSHHHEDLELTERIVKELFPQFTQAMGTYFAGTNCYFGNIFIMKQQIFSDYCNWLFQILEEFDRRANVKNYNQQEGRVNGYLAERLFGIYVISLFQKEIWSILELPRVHFCSGWSGVCGRLQNAVFPPGTKRRAVVKSIKQSFVF